MFIKKRKITKASIEELAKRYPQDIISDEEARNIVGGTLYLSESSMFLAQVGSGTDIRICSAGYATENLNGWGGSIEDYYLHQHQFGHTQNWAGGVTGNYPAIGKYEKDEYNGHIYNAEDWKYFQETGEYKFIGSSGAYPDVFPRTDCCKSFDYGALMSSGMPVPDFMKYSVSFSSAPAEAQARIRSLYPHLFSDSTGGGGSGTFGTSGNI